MGDKAPLEVNVDTKGIGEFAKPAEKAVGLAGQAGEYLARFLAPVEQALGMVTDHLTYTRWERRERFALRAKEFMAAKGLKEPTRKLPFAIGVPLLQAAALEENNEIQDVWARLLVNGADEGEPETRRAFVSILQDLTPADARLLSSIHAAFLEHGRNAVWAGALPDRFVTGKMREAMPAQDQEKLPPLSGPNHEALWNLLRLGLVANESMWDSMMIYWVVITPLAEAFVRACTIKNEQPQPQA